MAETGTQNITEVTEASSIATGDNIYLNHSNQLQQIDYDKLATAILNKLSTQSFSSLETTAKTVLGGINELNSKSYLLYGGIRITSGSNLNDYIEPGNYYCTSNVDAASIQNSPTNSAFTMKVEYSIGTSYPCQIVRVYNNRRTVYRFKTSSADWSDWVYFSDDATVLGQTINASDILTDIISDISEMDDINETCIRYVQGALLEGKSIYGFVLTAKAGTVLSQIIFGSFMGVSGMAVRGKSGSPIQWKDWKIL